MEWELAWISSNLHHYSSPEHAEAVKRNIEKRYLIRLLQDRIRGLEKRLEVLGR